MSIAARHLLALALSLGLTGVLAAPDVSRAGALTRTTRTWEHSARMERGQTLWIHGVNGAIRAEASSGDQMQVEATISGRRNDPKEVVVRVVPDSDGLTLCAIYPGRKSVCEGERYEMPVKNNDVDVEFVVRVPAGVRLVATTVNGGIRALGLDGEVRATTVNGGCEIETRSSGEARTVNGSVNATVGRLDESDQLDFSTVNGSVTVRIDGALDADVSASTVNGSLRSDYPIEMHGRWGPRAMKGKVGRGGARLQMTTVNGSVALRRGAAL